MVVICTYCGAAYAEDGPLGYVPHVLAIHANSEEARRIRKALVEPEPIYTQGVQT